MISTICKTPNSLAEWSQNWLDVMAFDPEGIERGIPYVYQMLGLPTPTIFYLDGWQECLQLILTNHADPRDFTVNRDSGKNPSFQLKYKETEFVDSSFTRFLGLLREEISLDWERTSPAYALERNEELTRLLHILLIEQTRAYQQWLLLKDQVFAQAHLTSSQQFIRNAHTVDLHFLKRQWLQLDATVLANQFYQQLLTSVYNWSLLLGFIKGKSFVTYFTHDSVYCIRPPMPNGGRYTFSNGEEYIVPLTA